MIGSMRWNICIGLTGFILTFFFSLPNNVLLTTIIRSLYCFLILFIFVFLVRWVLGTLIGLKEMGPAERSNGGEDHMKGTVVDFITPDEGINPSENLRPDANDEEHVHFSPLQVPKLSKTFNHPPEDLAQAIRKVTED